MKNLLLIAFPFIIFSCTKEEDSFASRIKPSEVRVQSTCDAPVNLAAFNIGTNGATFSWDSLAPAPDNGFWWQIKRTNDGRSIIRGVALSTDYSVVAGQYTLPVYDTRAVENPILPLTEYKFEVMALCTDSTKTPLTSIQFTTTDH